LYAKNNQLKSDKLFYKKIKAICMKKIILLSLICFHSCDIPYDGNSIITINAKIVNGNNEPIANKEVRIQNSYGDDNLESNTYKKKSDASGMISIKMFEPNGSAIISIEGADDYLSTEIWGINEDHFTGTEWNVGTIYLLKANELSLFTIQFNQLNAHKSVTSIQVDAIKYQEYYYFDSQYNPLYGNFQTVYQLKKNQTFTLKYSIFNSQTNSTDNISIPLSIGTSDLNYTITF
jgi:hypothetical protein